MPQNLIEKIAQKYAVGLMENEKVRSGDFLTISPAHVMTHDNTGAVMKKFAEIGVEKIANPRQVVHTLDHNIQDKSDANKAKYSKIEKFSAKMGCDFYPAGRGIGHQIMLEEGYALPGTFVVASDSHSNMYGGIGALGTPIVRTDAAAIWATGKTWWQIPPVVKVNLNGRLQSGVVGKDVIIALCGYFNNDEVLNTVIEFSGDGVKSLSLDQRLSIANMTTEWGALGGVFPADGITLEWLKQRTEALRKRGQSGVPSDADNPGSNPRLNYESLEHIELSLSDLRPDEDAVYSKTIEIDLNTIQPVIAGPDTVKVMQTAAQASSARIKINKAYLVSCVNSRVEDLSEAANVIEDRKVADGVEFYIAAASSEVQAESELRGDWQKLLDAGAIPLPPGCGPCIGLGAGLLEDGEVGISATNRNFKGRMGSKNAQAFLASPAVVAQSAVSGYIDLDWQGEQRELKTEIIAGASKPSAVTAVDIIDGFPEEITGEIIFCPVDNMNTDGIYPGKYTYVDDFTDEQQAAVAMENYDPEFQSIAKTGDVLVGGFNFGTGSSREQAATALKYRGIQLVIGGSFSATYLRNAINNGFLCITQPELVNKLKEDFGTEKLTRRIEEKAKIDFVNSRVVFGGQNYSINPVGKAAQEIIVAGGLENWVKQNISQR